MSDKAARFQRRLEARQVQRNREGETPPTKDPDDRRQGERRSTSMTPTEVEDWMKLNGIKGADRRRTDRRR